MDLYAAIAFLVMAEDYCCPGNDGSNDGAGSQPDTGNGADGGPQGKPRSTDDHVLLKRGKLYPESPIFSPSAHIGSDGMWIP